ncbi:protein of unknown function [Ralstonia solanacearum CMR15]|nr:protein of unknown function [Ralstonia solanacearum CMR15]
MLGAFVGGVPGNATRGSTGRAAVTAAAAHAGTAAPGASGFAHNAIQNPSHGVLVLWVGSLA